MCWDLLGRGASGHLLRLPSATYSNHPQTECTNIASGPRVLAGSVEMRTTEHLRAAQVGMKRASGRYLHVFWGFASKLFTGGRPLPVKRAIKVRRAAADPAKHGARARKGLHHEHSGATRCCRIYP